jgi:hypothetical protein
MCRQHRQVFVSQEILQGLQQKVVVGQKIIDFLFLGRRLRNIVKHSPVAHDVYRDLQKKNPNAAKYLAERKRLQHQRWFRRGQKWRTGSEGRIDDFKDSAMPTKEPNDPLETVMRLWNFIKDRTILGLLSRYSLW